MTHFWPIFGPFLGPFLSQKGPKLASNSVDLGSKGGPEMAQKGVKKGVLKTTFSRGAIGVGAFFDLFWVEKHRF